MHGPRKEKEIQSNGKDDDDDDEMDEQSSGAGAKSSSIEWQVSAESFPFFPSCFPRPSQAFRYYNNRFVPLGGFHYHASNATETEGMFLLERERERARNAN